MQIEKSVKKNLRKKRKIYSNDIPMKKTLWLLLILIYFFSINTLVHAKTMGIFSHTNDETNIWHCHTQTQSASDTKKNVDCCEITTSNEYSNIQLPYKYKNYTAQVTPHYNHLAKDPYTPNNYVLAVVWSPWRNTNIKYNKFSDLFGIIVHLS